MKGSRWSLFCLGLCVFKVSFCSHYFWISFYYWLSIIFTSFFFFQNFSLWFHDIALKFTDVSLQWKQQMCPVQIIWQVKVITNDVCNQPITHCWHYWWQKKEGLWKTISVCNYASNDFYSTAPLRYDSSHVSIFSSILSSFQANMTFTSSLFAQYRNILCIIY